MPAQNYEANMCGTKRQVEKSLEGWVTKLATSKAISGSEGMHREIWM
jgi:hypothetical protein